MPKRNARPAPTPATAVHDEQWVRLATVEGGQVVDVACSQLAALVPALPANPTRRGLWAVGIGDDDIRVDHLYLGSQRGRCAVIVSVRRTALEAARIRSAGAPAVQR